MPILISEGLLRRHPKVLMPGSTARLAALVAAFVAMPLVASAQAGDVESVLVPQRILLEGSMTRAQAERAAVENAMAEAVRRVAGVRVSGSELMMSGDSSGTITSRYLASVRVDAEGHVVGWSLERGRWSTEQRGHSSAALVYDAAVRVLVARDAGRADDGFRLAVRLGSPERLLVRGTALAGNDEVIVMLTATRDAFLTLVAMSGDSVARLAPNPVVRDARITAGVESAWPSNEWRERGLHFRVALPTGIAARTEVVAAVATLDAAPWPRDDGGPIALADFNRWLVAIPASQRAVAQRTVMVERTGVETMKEMAERR